MESGTGKRRWVKGLLIALCIILALLLLFLIFAAAYAGHLLKKIERYDENESFLTPEQVATMTELEDEMDPDYTGVVLDPEDVTFPTMVEMLPDPEDNFVQILLIGQDREPGQGRQRSDTMILCTFDVKNQCLTMTSFLRDMYVDIPGYQASKMNAAYAWGGMPLLKDTMAVNFGIEVDACVEVDFAGFKKVIDLVGGVDIQLTAIEADYLRNGFRYHDLVEGWNHLNGEQALTYARIRKLDSDFGRTQRQRNVLNAVIKSCKDAKLSELMTLLNEMLPMLTTDMTDTEIIQYAVNLFPVVAGGDVRTLRIPADGMYEYAWVGKQSVLLVDLEATRKLLHETLLTP